MTFLVFPIDDFSRLSECSGNLEMVGFLVNGILLSAETDASQVNAARIVVRLQSGKPCVSIFGVRCRENQGFLLDHFQGA